MLRIYQGEIGRCSTTTWKRACLFLLFGRVYRLLGKARFFLDLSNDGRSFTNVTLDDVNGGPFCSAIGWTR